MTTWPARLPIRPRITAAFAAVMTLLLVTLGVIAYLSMSAALLDQIDTGLRFRAAAIADTLPNGISEPANPRLEEPAEAFAQLTSVNGRVLRSSPGFSAPLLGSDDLAGVDKPAFFQRRVPGVTGPARLLAVPIATSGGPVVLIVGATMADRADALRRLGEVFVIGGPTAIGLACVAGWVVAGWAFRPVERMRQQASAISASGLDRRLTVPPARDELQRLARTLNGMLSRLDQSLTREREFLERASHELRTPLAALRAEVDLALSRHRSAAQLTDALLSVSQETDRLARLAEDLLVLARADDGRLPLHLEIVSLRDVLESAAALFTARALESEVTVTATAPDTPLSVDPLRLRQVLVNLLDNALRHTPRGGAVRVDATAIGNTHARIVVSDTGVGFPEDMISAESVGGHPHRHGQTGLGLRIVEAVLTSHGGTVSYRKNEDGGAAVELVLPLPGPDHGADVTTEVR